ncbi:MAG: pyridoxal phosphate-dependent aminotransferase [Gemmatimonadota bacterium]|nr:pyridoxal phosphate-dependent aminotransferase [Gemmatimonadota bacterium]MDH5759955.1 pyridoxal phosphate-dependent aminotransferase [Gemmatimonadota bacterium]
MPFSANIQRLQPSATIAVSTLAKRLASEGRDIINLSAGEPDFDTPAFIVDAAVEGIRSGETRYTPSAGLPGLRKAIAAFLSERSGREMDPDGVVVTAGAKQALFNACFSLFGPGDEVMIAAPYWTSYPELVTIARAEPVEVFGSEERGFKLTPEDLDAAFTERTRGLILNTPCNPTGAVYSVDELTAVAEWARDRGVWLISDEIYQNIYHLDDRTAAPGLLDVPAGSLGDWVLVDGASKSYAMTGWRLGFSYSSTEVAGQLTALQSHITSNTTTPTQIAGIAAYGNREAARASIANMVAAFRRRRNLVTSRMDELLPEIPYTTPEGAFYLFFRVDGLFEGDVQSATAWCSHLLNEVGVALVPGAAFGDDRWVRMSYAASDDVLEEALKRMASMIRGS